MNRPGSGTRIRVDDQRALGRSLERVIGHRGGVSVEAFDRIAAAVDASHYLLTPRAVVTPSCIADVAATMRFATANGEHVTFRSGGTSLSGQASTAGILVDTRRHFREIEILDAGARVRVGPGATVRQVNTRLLRYGRQLGPDPASEIACTIGGVIANNSSGMTCGITQNTYRTLESAMVVLASGTVVDSARPDADDLLRSAEPDLWSTLTNLRSKLVGDVRLRAEIERQFSIKNTMGYGINALLDHSTPAEMLVRLMIGSEGTLGFVAQATFQTVPIHAHLATGLVVFETLDAATNALVDLVATGATAIELMDAASLQAALKDPASRSVLPQEVAEHCALLVEYRAADAGELDAAVDAATTALAERGVEHTGFSGDRSTRDSLWHIRKGLYATVAGARPTGTTPLLEDIAVPVERLADTCAGLRGLFRTHGYADAVIFGHAKDGNVHFLLAEDFDVPANLVRYRAFTEDMVDLVLAAGGTLKAEHGTGRIMAPYVERQYGPDLHRVMRQIKQVFDPAGILNPDTILTDDSDLHLRDLKTTPPVEREVDSCVECGYCEPTCPSKDLTTTPRQRIVVRRAMVEAANRGDRRLVRELTRREKYDVVDTCAADGMCQLACPVLINTGDLVRRLRSDDARPVERTAWNLASRTWKLVTEAASRALSVTSRLPAVVVAVPNIAMRRFLGTDTIPLWSSDLPRGGVRRRSTSTPDAPDAVFFSACVGSMFGPTEGGHGVADAFASLARKSGLQLRVPTDIDDLCCGTPWKSKGFGEGYATISRRTIDALWAASDGGRLPIVCDNSSCSEGLGLAVERAVADDVQRNSLRIVDAVDFAAEFMVGRLTVQTPLDTIAVHPTCSSARAGSNTHLLELAGAAATTVTVPDDWGCCAFAGDRGMLHPELTQSATAREAAEITASDFDAYVSCNRTCEIAMSRATGKAYRHVLEVLDRVATADNRKSRLPHASRSGVD